MELFIEVREANIVPKHGTSRKTGKPYSMYEQAAFVSLPTGESRKVTLSHEEGDQPLPVGRYQPKPSAVWVGDFGALSISTRAKHWESVNAKPAQKAA
jgi:hypothetical protein